jgi:hypothetical protein
MRILAEERGGKTSGILTQEKGGGGKKTSGKDLSRRCYGELTKRVQGIYRRRMREKRREVSVDLPDRKKGMRR